MKPRRSAALVATGLLSMMALSLMATARAGAQPPDCPPGPPPYEASTMNRRTPKECNLQGKVIRDYGVGATVGPEGTTVGTESLTEFGHELFAIRTEDDGDVVLEHMGNELAGRDHAVGDVGSGNSSPHPCYDIEWQSSGYVESHTHEWRIRTATIPSYLNSTNAIEAIRDGFRNMTQVNNDCGRPDYVSATSNYLGSTYNSANMDNNGVCVGYFSKDEVNVTDFGSLPGTAIARNCYWYIAAELVESDVRFDSAETWTLNPGPDCSNKYDLASISTHERGHTYGLADLDPTYHKKLTMSGEAYKCSEQHRTLGAGDYIGLEDKY